MVQRTGFRNIIKRKESFEIALQEEQKKKEEEAKRQKAKMKRVKGKGMSSLKK